MKQRLSLTLVLVILMGTLLTGCAGLEDLTGNIVLPTGAPTALLQTTTDSGEAAAQAVSQTAPTQSPAITGDTEVAVQVPTAVEAAAQSGIAELTAQEQLFIDLYNRVNPGVVSVYMTTGGGSGFVIDADGYIVTNNHVIAEGGPITVRFHDGETKDAELIGADPQADLALLKVEAAPGELTALPLGDSSALEVGQFVVAIGSPFGLENTMTTGIVSGLSRSLPTDIASLSTYQVPSVIQTDAAINPGNSGGPLINLAGEVVGVNTAIESPVRANSGVGFSVPSNVVKVVIPQLRESGAVKYPWLGIAGGTLTPDAAEEMGLDRSTRGVLVSQVTVGGPAEAAGLRGGNAETGLGGDVIVGVDGRTVTQFDDLLGYIVQEATIGQTIELTILRNGQTESIRVTLGERPETPVQPAPQLEETP